MMNLCLRYTKNEEDALEILNTGFLKIFKNINQYNSQKATLATWVRTIIINTSIDFIRIKGNSFITSEIQEADNSFEVPNVFNKMNASEILQLVRSLPPATQIVFNLYAIEGYNHKEIAQLLKISEGTSKWHLSEARKKLQHLIQAHELM